MRAGILACFAGPRRHHGTHDRLTHLDKGGRTMKLSLTRCGLALLAALALSVPARADLTEGMTKGTPEIKSIGTMTFGPEGILFVADPQSTTIFAIATGDTKGGEAAKEGLKVANVNEKVASMLGIESGQLAVRDLVVNPASANVYLGVMRGRGTDAAPVIVRVDGSGKLSEFGLKD